jgi:hypothetical protein
VRAANGPEQAITGSRAPTRLEAIRAFTRNDRLDMEYDPFKALSVIKTLKPRGDTRHPPQREEA